jgi:SAM-dependent methyltransferase
MTHTKARWQAAYNTQSAPESLGGGLRQFNGYRHPRLYAMLMTGLRRATQTWQNWDVLDAGCGSGDTGGFLAEQNRVTGLDFSWQMAGYAQRIYERVTVGDVEQLPFERESFDGVLAVGVWQCLTPNTPFLAEAARVLRPAGQVVLGWILNREYVLYRRGVRFRLDPTVHLNLLTTTEIPYRLAAAGLQVERVYAAVFPLGVVGLKHIPRWLATLVPAYTVLCRKGFG